MSDHGEYRDDPVTPQPEELGGAGPWRNVPKPTIEELTTPSVEVVDVPQMPLVVKVVGLALVVILLVLAAWLGLSLGGASTPGPSPTPTPTVDESLWPLEPPVTLGELVQGETTTTRAGTQGDRDIVTTKYSDGSSKIVLLLSRPESDLASYLDELTVEPVEDDEPFGESTCGVSGDTKLPVCARVVDDTAIAVVGLSNQSFATVAGLVDSFYSALQ